MTTTAEAASRWHQRGWPPFPLPAGDKYPPPAGVTGADGVDLTPAQLRALPWTGNVGVRMTIDVIGLDVDDYDGKPGGATLDALIAELGPLPPTVISTNRPGTRSGIYLYRVPVGMHWVATLPGIDIIQRSHRYMATWCSIHPSGRPYVLIEEASGEECDVPGVEDLPDLPWPWIRRLSRAAEGEHHSHAVDLDVVLAFVETHTEAEAPGYLSVIVEHFDMKVDEGHSRHDSMQHCLTWAMESARARLFSAAEALNALATAWVSRHTDHRRAEVHSERRVTEFDAMVRHAVGKALAKTPTELYRIHDDVVGITIGDAGVPPEVEHPEAEPEPRYLVWRHLWAAEDDDHAWLVERFWPLGRALALWAAAKQGKSELLQWIAFERSEGRDPFSGRAVEPIRFGYYDYEMARSDLRDRGDDFGFWGHEFENLYYALLPPLAPLDTDAGGRMFEEWVMDEHLRAVIIDTFGRAVVGKEDEADTVRAFHRFTGARLKRWGVSYLRADHAGKDVTKGQRGTSAKRDDLDVIWQLAQTKAGTFLDCSGSSRLSWVGPTLNVERLKGEFIAYRFRALDMVDMVDVAVESKIAQLDQLSIPLDWGRDRIVTELRAKGEPVGKIKVLTDAIRIRRIRRQTDGMR